MVPPHWIEPDGDLSFRRYFDNEMKEYSNDDMAELMLEFKYLSAYIDGDGDLVFSYDLANFDNECPTSLAENIRLFFSITEVAVSRLIED